jgi:hypothetical protein
MLFTYFLNDLEMVPFAPFITGITLVFTFHMRCIFIERSSSAYFLNTFLSPGIATYINIHVLFSFFIIIIIISSSSSFANINNGGNYQFHANMLLQNLSTNFLMT